MTTKADSQGIQRPRVAVVVGMHRSGTSAIARGLQAVGVDTGDRLVPGEEGINAKGYWEDIDVVAVNVEMLDALDRRWDSVLPLDAQEVDRLVEAGFVERAASVLREKCRHRAIYGFKDPRTALFLPIWQRVFADGGFDARYVIAVRNPLSVIASLAKRDGFDATYASLLWVNHMLCSLRGVTPSQSIVVDYDRLMAAADAELQRVAALLGTAVDAQALELYRNEFLDEALRHSRHAVEELRATPAARLAADTYEFLADAAVDRVRLDSRGSGDVIEGLCRSWDHLRPIIELLVQERSRAADAEQIVKEQETSLADRDRRAAALELEHAARTRELADSIARRDAVIAELERSIGELRSSLSWRVTGPVRWLVTASKALLRGLVPMPKPVAKADLRRPSG